MRLSRIIAIGTLLVAILSVAAYGVALASGYTHADIRRNVRSFLGLPKFWVRKFNDDPAGYAERTCPKTPLVIVTGGQSNAANAYDPVRPGPPVPNGFMYFSGKCYALRSPVLGTTGERDSLWPALGAALTRRTGRPVLFINGAVGGVQLGDWLDSRSRYLDRLVGQLRGVRQLGYRPDLVLWIQGETDAATMIRPALYVDQMRALIARFDAVGATPADARWVVYRSTRCMHRRNNGPDVDRAVAAFAATSPRLVLGPLVSAYDDGYRRDTCHMNGRGRDRLVGETMRTLEPLLVSRGINPQFVDEAASK